MAGQNYSAHQQKLIRNYYENLDAIMLQKLQELVTELYLAETEPKTRRLWERVEKAMMKMEVPADILSYIMKEKDVKLLARHVETWFTQSGAS